MESGRPIPELCAAPPGNADVAVTWHTGEWPGGNEQVFREWAGGVKPGGVKHCVRFARSGADYVLKFGGVADFWAAADGSRVRCYASAGVPDVVVHHAFLDQTLPLLLSRRSIAAFHASAVARKQGAVAFSGRSGHGKSTLAGHFASHGCPLLSDDCLALHFDDGRPVAQPGYPEVRLWRDSLQLIAPDAGDLPCLPDQELKYYYGGGNALPFSSNCAPLRRFYLLEPKLQGDLEILPLRGADSLYKLIALQFCLDSEDAAELSTNFKTAEALLRSGRCYSLRVPRDLDKFASYAERVAAHIDSDVS